MLILEKLRNFVGLTEEVEETFEECLTTQPTAAVRPVVVIEAPVEIEAPVVETETVEEEEVVATAPEPTKLERLVAKRQAEVERERQAKAAFEAEVAETEAIKAEYQRKANEARAEKAKLESIAKEIRLAISAADQACERAENARVSKEAMTNQYVNSLVDINQRNEDFANALLNEFGC